MTYELGDARRNAAADAKARYDAGASVAAIAADLHRSYGYTHRLLEEAGTTFRPRGRRGEKASR